MKLFIPKSDEENMKTRGIQATDIALIGMMAALMEGAKLALTFLPNIELVSALVIIFTLCFGKKVYYAVCVFVLMECGIYGLGIWTFSYFYIWPLLVFLTNRLQRAQSVWVYAILSGSFGLSFGLLCAIPYFWIGNTTGDIRGGLYAAFTWWIAGIPWDVVHCAGNFVIMLVLYHPLKHILEKIKRSPGR